jgi:hypothetical protein
MIRSEELEATEAFLQRSACQVANVPSGRSSVMTAFVAPSVLFRIKLAVSPIARRLR